MIHLVVTKQIASIVNIKQTATCTHHEYTQGSNWAIVLVTYLIVTTLIL